MPIHTLRHGCKINYALRVGKRLPDGYHEIESIFLPVQQPFDRIDISHIQDHGGISVSFYDAAEPARPFPGIDPQHNSLTQAYHWYAARTGLTPALSIKVYKGIPAGGGLGGGSANAAALLEYLQGLAADAQTGVMPLDREDLLESSKSLGADVPFFLLNKPAYVTGIGEKLTPIANPAAGKFLLIARPDLSISTAWAYRQLDLLREGNINKTVKNGKLSKNAAKQGLTSELHQANYSTPAGLTGYGNDFESVVFPLYPELTRLKNDISEHGAELVRLSGTGACMFAVFADMSKMEEAARNLASRNIMVYSQRI